jgi:hypothetical protein
MTKYLGMVQGGKMVVSNGHGYFYL